MGWFAPLLLLVQATQPTPIAADSAEALRKLARKAERQYEYLMRSRAPVRHGSPTPASHCDEIVGRFCLTYDSGEKRRPEPAIPGEVIVARQEAVEALRRAFAALPGELNTAGPLLRYLIEDGRAAEAVSAARTFNWASGDTAWGPFLEGYALHAAGEDTLAEVRFDEALARLPHGERRRLERVSELLSPKEQGIYGRLKEAEQRAYEEALWRLADPLYLTPGNERRAEHLARHVWSRLLGVAPVVSRMSHWGDDLEQLTLRYGVPTSRERLLGWMWSLQSSESMIEYYDREQLAYVPETLRSEGFPPTPPPGEKWPLDNTRARSGYHPSTFRRLVPLDHQLTRFPSGASVVLRLDGALPPDSLSRGGESFQSGLFLLDESYRPTGERRGAARLAGDTALVSYETTLSPGHYVYSLEVLEEETRLAGRARYAVELPHLLPDGLALSDPLVAYPYGSAPLPAGRQDGRLRPRASLTLSPGDTIGLYAEAHNLHAGSDRMAHYQVELRVGAAAEPSVLARAVGWLGRKLGLAKPEATPRLAWEGEAPARAAAVLAVDLPLQDLKPGLYAIELTVSDLVGRQRRSTTRLIRIAGASERDGRSPRPR
jgi:hypothetical protein